MRTRLKDVIESLIFVSLEPLNLEKIKNIYKASRKIPPISKPITSPVEVIDVMLNLCRIIKYKKEATTTLNIYNLLLFLLFLCVGFIILKIYPTDINSNNKNHFHRVGQ